MSAVAFTELEQTVILIAEKDPIATIEDRPESFFARLCGLRERPPGLANSRLEALRRLVVRLRHGSCEQASQEVELALGAGFSIEQIRLLASGLTSAKSVRSTVVTAASATWRTP